METELTDKQAAFIEALKSKHGNISTSCEAANIARSTYYEWLDKSDTFRQKKEDAIEGLYDFVESKLMEQIREGNTIAIIFFAKTKMKGRGYVEKQQIETQGDFKSVVILPHNGRDLNGMSLEEMSKLYEEKRKELEQLNLK